MVYQRQFASASDACVQARALGVVLVGGGGGSGGGMSWRFDASYWERCLLGIRRRMLKEEKPESYACLKGVMNGRVGRYLAIIVRYGGEERWEESSGEDDRIKFRMTG